MRSLTRPERTRVVRRIAADPTSTALLLAGPTALELWPGVRSVTEVDGRLRVEAVLASTGLASASVRALPPRRTPTSFVVRFDWTGTGIPDAAGELTLAYAPTGDGTPSTHAVLTLETAEGGTAVLGAAALAAMAEGFLANLARAAELRSRAA